MGQREVAMASLGGAVTGPEELTADLAVGQWPWQWERVPGSGTVSLAVGHSPCGAALQGW